MGAHAAPCGPAALGGAGCALCQHWVWALGWWCRVPTWPQGDGLVPSEPPPPPPKDGWYRLCRCTVCSVGSSEAPPCLQGNAVLCHAGASPGGGHHPWALLHAQGRRWGKANPPVRLHRAPRPAGGGGMGGAGAAGGGEGWLCAMQSIPSPWVEDEEEEEDDGWEPWRIWGS